MQPTSVEISTQKVESYRFEVAPGGRPVLVVKSDTPVNISIFTLKEFERTRPPSIMMVNVLEARIAMPSDAGEKYVFVSTSPVNLGIHPGTIAEASAEMRKGKNVERVYVKFYGRVGDVQKIPRIAPGVVLTGHAEGEVCIVDNGELKQSSRENCYSGDFAIKFDEFKDVYIVVTKPGVVEYSVYATLEMLLALGTCG
ncbi:hypothetical protein [Pyrobaculum aerophilum]|nr:hypothetical protein [Pyrobaculum aerophilum]